MSKILPADFYDLPTTEVARGLLGQMLCRRAESGLCVGRIVETEAYLGAEDLACHSAKGKTARTEVMFGPAGRAYIYLIYGMYHCLNIVTRPAGEPEAVLIRALQPIRLGEEDEQGRDMKKILNGPGKLCRELGIGKALNGAKLTKRNGLWIEEGKEIPPEEIIEAKRIGVEYAGGWKDQPLRFYIKGNPFVSKK